MADIGMNIRLIKHENGEVELESNDESTIDIETIDLDEMSKVELLELREKLEDYLEKVEDTTLQDEIENMLDEVEDLLDE